jgi:hypothetical protein
MLAIYSPRGSRLKGFHPLHGQSLDRRFLGITPLRFQLIRTAAACGASVFDGVRLLRTCIEARSHFEDLSVWHVSAAAGSRLARLRNKLVRGGGSEGMIEKSIRSYSEYDAEDISLTGFADVRLRNDGVIREFESMVEAAELVRFSV